MKTWRKFNLDSSSHDQRDYRLQFQKHSSLPNTVHLGPECPPVFDQGTIGSCTGNAASTMFSFLVRKKTGIKFIPSRLFLYYNTRILEGTVKEDSGATLRNTMKSLVRHGVCPETLWPYLSQNLFAEPSPRCYQEGLERQALSYARVGPTLFDMKSVLADGFVFVMGILIYESFMTRKTAREGRVPLPKKTSEKCLGGHAICVMGYDDLQRAFLVRNSWGTRWGLRGNFWLPYTYAIDTTLSFDSWVLYDAETISTEGSRATIVKPVTN